MGDFCIVPSSGHTKLYERISSSWKSQSQIEVLTIPKVVEWVGAYLKGNNINNPEFIPSAGELVKFIDRQRKLEGKTAFSELGLPEAVQVPYTLPGQGKHTYTVRGTRIYNEQGEERFKESDPQSKTHRNRILANLAIMQGNAVMVEYRGSDYVVYKDGTIVSASGNTPGHIMNWAANDGNRKTIMNSAVEKFKALSSNALQDNSVNLNSITKQVVENFIKAGIKVHGRKGIESYYNTHRSFDGVMQSVEETKEMQEIKAKAIADSTFMKAPNGKDTNLTERQWLQVRTKAFKDWFGDWEKYAPTSDSSKVEEQLALVFERIPELSKIGSIREYAAYLVDRFPNSVDRSIYWHGTNEDLSEGFKSAKKGKGSGAPETQSRNDFYLAKQAWTVLQYVNGVNRNSVDKNGFAHWNKLWWELKEIMSNGRRENNNWKDMVIGEDTVRQGIPNKKGVFNRDKGGGNGKWLSERKADYGYENKSDKEFFEDILGIQWGKDTFNTWTERNAETFKALEKTQKGIYPAIINTQNPIREKGQNTYYEEQRGLFTQAEREGNDAILGEYTDNEFGSDVAVVLNASEKNVHFLGTKEDIEGFKKWLEENRASKVVDENGEPLVVYHHTNNEFTVFNRAKQNYDEFYFTTSKSEKRIYSPNDAFKKYHIPVFLNIRTLRYAKGTGVLYENEDSAKLQEKKIKEHLNLSIKENSSTSKEEKLELRKKINALAREIRSLRSLKYGNYETYPGGTRFRGEGDLSTGGIKVRFFEDEDFYVVFYPNQIKSATANSGEFSPFDNDIQRFQTPEGEIYGFVDEKGDIFLDETVIKPEHPIHEYTHLWDRAVARTNPKLWKKGISLMKQTSLWKVVEDDANYGKKWQNIKKNNLSKYENLIASEVHARLVGTEGEKWLVDRAKELGSDSLISKLQQWLTDFWKALKNTFGAWSDADIATLTLADFNHMTVRDMINGINPNTVKSAMTMQTNAEQAPMSPAREKTLKTLRDYWTWQKQHISFDRAHHKYYIDGKIADYSVTELKDKIYGKVDLQEDFSHSTAMGNSVDALTRDFFTPKSNYATKKYPNLNDARKKAVLSDLKRFKEYLDKEFKNSDGKPDYTVITSEMFFAARIKEGKDTKTIAGTPDMVVIDGNGDVWLYDMKVKKNSIEAYNNRRDYTFQLNAYRQLLETAMPELKGRIKGLRLIWFDTSYPAQGREARFVTDANGNVTVTDLTVDNLPLAEYQKWATPSLKRDVKDSIKPLKNGDDVLSSPSPINNRWREEIIAQRNQTSQAVDTSKIADKSAAFGVVINPGLKANYEQWQKNNPTGVVAYKVDFNHYNTPAEVKAGHIGNPFSEGSDRGAQTVQQFYDWIITGNNFGNEKATEEYRKAIVNKILETPNNSPVLYYTELNRPSHATVIGYLINNKPLLEKAASAQQTAQQQNSLSTPAVKDNTFEPSSSSNDAERFNSQNESKNIISSSKTILSNEELKYWNAQGVDDMPRILSASERTDPAFHVKEILDIINGKKTVPQWGIVNGKRQVVGQVTGKDFAGLYLITKHDGLPMLELLETKIPKLIHFSITTLGGTQYEPGVMKYNDLLDRIQEYINQGLDPESVTVRIDPILPGVTKFDDIENVVKRASEMGIKRIRFSIMDAYSHTKEAMKGIYDFDIYYDGFHAKTQYQNQIVDFMLSMKDKYGVTIGTCAEPLVKAGIQKDGCLSVAAVNQMLGTSIEDKGKDNNDQRELCSCYGGKIDALAYGSKCASHCIYCYAKHMNDKALEYYNEDGTLKDTVFTRATRAIQPVTQQNTSPATQQKTSSSPQSSATDSSQASEKKNVQRPESPAFDSALKEPDERIKNFYSAFTPQQVKDRGAMIADYFSNIIDRYIEEQLQIQASEIAVLEEIISSSDYTEEDKENARVEKADRNRMLELLKDPIKGRQAAVQYMGIGNMVTAVQKRIKSNIRGRNAARDKKWQDVLDYFTELFNAQASMSIEEKEGIRIVDLEEGKVGENTSAEQDNIDENDGNDETGHTTASGNDGWIFKVRYTDPFNSLSKRVKRIMYNVEMDIADDLGNPRKYSMGQIYVSLLSYLSKEMQSPDDFIQVNTSFLNDPSMSIGKDFNRRDINRANYPAGYPTFPVLEKMRSKYPWVGQIIRRLTQDYQSSQYNKDLQYSPTMGAVCSQFYTNFKKAFIPYAKIQTGDNTTGVIPLNYDMEEQSQLDRLKANFNNGFVMTKDSIYNADRTINRNAAKRLVQTIDKADVNVANHSNTLMHKDDRDLPPAKEDVDDMNKFIKDVQYILMSFGIGDSSNDDYISALLGPSNGEALVNLLHDLREIAQDISELTDSSANNYNYIVSNVDSTGANRWNTFFQGRGFITDVSYVQSFYDSTVKKTKYSYSADNYLQKTFRQLYEMDDATRRAYMDEHYRKYEWFYDHDAGKWRNKWLEILYEGPKGTYGHIFTGVLPYRNIDNVSAVTKKGVEARNYVDWTPSDIWYVQDRNYGDDSSDFGYYLAPIFADSPMSMTIRGPKLNREDVMNAFVSLVQQEMWRIKYVTEDRAQAVKEGRVNPIANFDLDDEGNGKGKEFCFLPELNRYRFSTGRTFLEEMAEMKKRKASKEEIEDAQRQALEDILSQRYSEYLEENSDLIPQGRDMELEYLNMTYANVAIIQATTVDLAYYSSAVDFQKRFKEVYAGGIQLNTNSRYGKKTENVILVEDDVIVSPSYKQIAKVVDGSSNLTNKEKERIKGLFKEVNVADAQAMRAMHSFVSVMDMIGNWDTRKEEALNRFDNGTWTMEDFDVIYQTIKPFVYAVIEKNSGLVDNEDNPVLGADGKPVSIPVPVQHKNSEICMLMMYDLITRHSGFNNSPVYKGLSKFMASRLDASGKPIIDMIQFESAGKVGNQGVINISYSRKKVAQILSEGIELNENSKNNNDTLTYEDFNTLYQAEKEKKDKKLPNSASTVLKDAWKKIRKDLDKALDDDTITQERYNELVDMLRPDEQEIMGILDTALIKEGGAYIINPEYVQTIPFDNYYQAQPTPEHHIDAEASFGSQARNIIVADLPENLQLVLEGTVKGKKAEQVKKGRDAIIDFMYELLDENLLEDFYGTSTKKGLVDIFKDKNSFRKAIEDVVRGNPKYGQDFADALKLDKNGNFILSPNSPNMFHLMQDIVTSFFKNHITKQKINGAALIQAAGIGLDNDLRILFDKDGKPIGAECYMPATSRRFFEPFLKRDRDGNMYLDAEGLKKSGLDKAIGYRIPSENKSSMLPLIIKGFTPMQNGSCIVLPAEITTLAGSDFDVDKMFIMLSSFFVSNYRKADARKDFAKSRKLFDWISRIGVLGEHMQEGDEIEGAEEEAFNKWFEENKESYRRKTPKIIKVEYDFSKSPEENGRKARNNMIIQMMYKILVSKEGSESLFNPQGFPDVERTAKMMKILTNTRLREALYIKFGGDLDKMASFALEGSEKELKKFIDENILPESPIYPQAFAHAHARNMAGSKQIGIYAVQASMGAKFQRANITIKEHRQIELDGKHTDVDRSDGGRRLKNTGQMVGASADNGKKPNLTDMGSTDDTAAIIGYLLRAGYTHSQAALLIAQPEMQMSGFSTKGFLRRVSHSPKSLPKGQLTSKDLVLNILAGNDAKEDIIKRAVWEVLSQHEAMEYVTQVSRADSPNGAMDNSFAGARLQRYKVDLLQGKMEEKDYPFYMRGALSNDVIDVKQGKAAVREALKKQPLAFLHGMYSLGISSLGDLASPFFYMLSEEFDNKIVKPILYNMPEEMSDATKKKILDRVYTDWITFTLSGSALFGNEDGASASNKRDYYLKEFASDFRKVLQNNPDIRELVGPILEADGNRVVLRNVGTLLKGQKEDVSRRLTSLIYGIDPNNPNKEAQKLAKDLLMFSYYDSGINFRHDSYSSVLSTQFLTLIETYTEALNKVNSSIEEGMDKRFTDQFMLTNPEAALPTSNMEDKPWFSLGSERIEIDMNISGLPNKWIINPATTRNRRYNGVSPYTYIRTSFGLYKLNEEMFKANGAMAVYDRVPDYGTTSSRPIYSSQETLERMVELYPVGIYNDNSKEDGLTAAYNSITQTAPPPVSRTEAHANPVIQSTNNSSSPVPYNSPSVDNDMYDALSNTSSSDASAPPFTGEDYDNINSFGEMSYEQLAGGTDEEMASILYTKQGNETIDKPQCTVKKQ